MLMWQRLGPEDMALTDGDDDLFSDIASIVETLGELTELYVQPPTANHGTVIAELRGTHTGRLEPSDFERGHPVLFFIYDLEPETME